MAGLIERVKWRIAELLNLSRRQCWTDLVSWVLYRWKNDPDWRSLNPWSPIGESCRRDAAACGRCYCGKLASDGSVLRRGEYVCVTPMPGRASDRMCSRPDGHDGFHRCGGVEWGPVADA